MRFKHFIKTPQLILVLGLIPVIGFSQSYFNRLIGTEIHTGSARALAMGNTNSVSDRSSAVLLTNPAGLAIVRSGLALDLHSAISSTMERRSLDLMDTFGDFLTEGDYVLNRNRNFSFNGGLTYGLALNKFRTGLGISIGQLTSFNYEYQEEIRGRASLEDGDIGNRDPLLGYHVFSTEGGFNHVTVGGGLQFGIVKNYILGAGFSYHTVMGSEFSEDYFVDTVLVDPVYMSNVLSRHFKTEPNSGGFYSFGLNFSTGTGLTVALSLDSELEIDSDNYQAPGFNIASGLPIYASYIDSTTQVSYLPRGLNYIKPFTQRLGLEYRTVGEVPMVIAFEWQQTAEYNSDLADTTLNMPCFESWKFGFEYLALKTIPVRAGLEFRKPRFKGVSPASIFTFGTGKQFGNLSVDLAGAYYIITYDYPDVFPVSGDVRPDLDRVSESNLSVAVSIKYTL